MSTHAVQHEGVRALALAAKPFGSERASVRRENAAARRIMWRYLTLYVFVRKYESGEFSCSSLQSGWQHRLADIDGADDYSVC